MVDLTDIAPLTRGVSIRGRELAVHGLSAGDIAQLLAEFPEVKALFAKKDERGLKGLKSLDASALMGLPDRVIDAVVAKGLRLDDPSQTALLALGEKAEALAAVVELTLPTGLDPLLKLVDALGLAAPASAPEGGGVRLKVKPSPASQKPSTN